MKLAISNIAWQLHEDDTIAMKMQELGVKGVEIAPMSRLNAFAPSIVKDAKMTLMRKDLDVLAKRLEEIPTRQFTSAKDVAGLVYYLLFESENIHGQSINVDGGWYLG